MDSETPPQDHFTGGGIAFSEKKSGSQGSGDFVADDQTTDGGRNDEIHFGKMRGQLAAKFFGDGGMLEN